MDISQTKALTFDCYGTLIDWETGILAALKSWVDAQTVAVDADHLLATFGQAETEAEQAHPSEVYTEILRRTMAGMATLLKVSYTPEDADRLANSVGDWPVFPDSVEALERLKKRFKLVVVSNVPFGQATGSSVRCTRNRGGCGCIQTRSSHVRARVCRAQ